MGVDCTLKLPKIHVLNVDGGLGEIKLVQPLYSVNAGMKTGEIAIEPAKDRRYDFELSVGIGAVKGTFNSDANPEFKIKSKVAVGAIRHE